MRKINRRNFLKAAGVLSAAVAGSLLAGCGGSDTGAGAAASDLSAYNELTVGTDHTDLTATIKVINHRTDLIQDGTFDGYVAEFQKLYPNITIEYEGITDYAGDMTTRLTSQEWGDVCMIPTTIPLTELSDYFYPLCDLSGIQEDYNFAANRAFGGKVYGIPSTGNAQGVIYNKRVFEEAGITSLPKTPTEFLDALQKIRDYDPSIDPLYTNYAAGWTMSAWDAYIGVFRGEQTNGIPFIYLGRSADGIHWDFDRDKIPFVNEQGEPFMPPYAYDPRLVKVEDTYYIIWCQDFYGASIGIAKTRDFQTFTRVENPFVPFNRNAVLFPRKINGMFTLLSRPSDSGHTPFGDIFLSQSPDMEFWGRHRHVMGKSGNWWENLKIGGGAAPIETSEGWLLFYHGVTGTCNGYVYSIGGAILDRDEPSRVLHLCSTFLLTPETDYEERGFVPNVCFPCATLQDAATGRIALYYGCADSYVGLAFTTADEVVDYIKAHDQTSDADRELGLR